MFTMTVVCAWCQRLGTVRVLGEKEPRNDAVSHGICDEHAVEVLAEARAGVGGVGRLAS